MQKRTLTHCLVGVRRILAEVSKDIINNSENGINHISEVLPEELIHPMLPKNLARRQSKVRALQIGINYLSYYGCRMPHAAAKAARVLIESGELQGWNTPSNVELITNK